MSGACLGSRPWPLGGAARDRPRRADRDRGRDLAGLPVRAQLREPHRGRHRGRDHVAADGADHHRRRDRPVGRVDGSACRRRSSASCTPPASRSRSAIPIVLVDRRARRAAQRRPRDPCSACRRSSSRSARSRCTADSPSSSSGRAASASSRLVHDVRVRHGPGPADPVAVRHLPGAGDRARRRYSTGRGSDARSTPSARTQRRPLLGRPGRADQAVAVRALAAPSRRWPASS